MAKMLINLNQICNFNEVDLKHTLTTNDTRRYDPHGNGICNGFSIENKSSNSFSERGNPLALGWSGSIMHGGQRIQRIFLQ